MPVAGARRLTTLVGPWFDPRVRNDSRIADGVLLAGSLYPNCASMALRGIGGDIGRECRSQLMTQLVGGRGERVALVRQLTQRSCSTEQRQSQRLGVSLVPLRPNIQRLFERHARRMDLGSDRRWR